MCRTSPSLSREQYFFEAIAGGAAGYVLKSQAERDILAASRAVLRGESFIYPAAPPSLMRSDLDRLASGERPGRGPITVNRSEFSAGLIRVAALG